MAKKPPSEKARQDSINKELVDRVEKRWWNTQIDIIDAKAKSASSQLKAEEELRKASALSQLKAEKELSKARLKAIAMEDAASRMDAEHTRKKEKQISDQQLSDQEKLGKSHIDYNQMRDLATRMDNEDSYNKDVELAEKHMAYNEMMFEADKMQAADTRKKENELASEHLKYLAMMNDAERENVDFDQARAKRARENNKAGWQNTMKLSGNIMGEQFQIFGNILQRSSQILTTFGLTMSSVASIMLVASQTIYRAGLAISESMGINLSAGISRAIGREIGQLKSVFSSGPMVTAAQQANVGDTFSQQFGTILTKPLERVFAQAARQINLTGQEYISGIRSLTPMLGGFDKAQAAFEKSVKVFTQQGLTSREAAQFVAEKQELVARYSGSAATELLKAAAAAKQAGFSLEKLQSFSDSIVTDFGGFMDKAAELFALGIDVPIAELAQASLSGGAPEVLKVLKQSLGDLSNLTQAQQIGIQQATGMSLAELKGIKNSDEIRADLAEKADKEALKYMSDQSALLEKIYNIGLVGGLLVVASILTSILSSTMTTAVNTGIMAGKSMLGGAMSALGTMGKVGMGVASAATGIGVGTQIATSMGAPTKKAVIGSVIGTALGASIGFGVGGLPGAYIGASLGGTAGGAITGAMEGDDVVSQPGYGSRMLQTQHGSVALNNQDTIVAYANDMVANPTGVELLSKGALVGSKEPQTTQSGMNLLSKGALATKKESPANVTVNMDLDRLERKLEALHQTLSSTSAPGNVYLDGRRVGTSLRNNLGVTDKMAATKSFS